jgi:HAD superfamily hydrolase (TIGR01509 family)
VITTILFDVDGTLIDSVDLHARAWEEAFRHFGIPAAYEDIRLEIGKGGDQLLPSFVPPAVLAERKEEIEGFRSRLFQETYLPQVRPFPEVRALFERLRADDKRLVLASSGKADEVERYQRIAGIEDLIDGFTSSDDAERSKPFGDIFAAALQKAEADPREAMVVGDTPYDAEAARMAGCRSIGVLCGGFTEASLREAGRGGGLSRPRGPAP